MTTFRWRKLGQIFDPAVHGLPAGCVSHAQSPQAVVHDDFIRIFFSTREVDPANGKFLSYPTYVDMSRDLSTIIEVAERPVISLGGLGCFDEHGIFPLSPTPVGDELYAYTTGWNRRVSVSVDTAIGLAISRDGGKSFERNGAGPIVGPTPTEPFLVGDGFVRRFGDTYHMWYIFGVGWKVFAPAAPPDRIYKIGHAISSDGIAWEKPTEGKAIVPDQIGEDESQALPSVIEIDGRYHMVFCYRHSYDFRTNPARGYRIGHAVSDDLLNWERDDENPALVGTPGAWDADMQCYPHLFSCDGATYLLYNGSMFGRDGFGAAILERP